MILHRLIKDVTAKMNRNQQESLHVVQPNASSPTDTLKRSSSTSILFRKSKQFMISVTVISLVIVFAMASTNNLVQSIHSSIDIRVLQQSFIKPVCDKSSNQQFVGFWHIGGSNQPTDVSRDDFVLKQFNEIQSTHLFSQCNYYDVTLNYVTRVNLSQQTKDILRSDERFHELPPTNIENMDEDEEYFEFTTLMELYSYCRNLPEEQDAVAFYIHSKTHDEWRLWMENYLLGPECADCIEDPTKMAW